MIMTFNEKTNVLKIKNKLQSNTRPMFILMKERASTSGATLERTAVPMSAVKVSW